MCDVILGEDDVSDAFFCLCFVGEGLLLRKRETKLPDLDDDVTDGVASFTATSSELLPEEEGDKSLGRFPLQSGSLEEKLDDFDDCALGGRCVTSCDDVTGTGACEGEDVLDLEEDLTNEKRDLAGD